MAKLSLTLACGNYSHTRALMDRTVQPEGIELNYISLEPQEIFFRMLKHREFDVSELSLSAHIITRSQNKLGFVAVPVFPSRVFRHSAIYINEASGIKKPEDLAGKRMGTREYHMTAAVWVRGILQHDYGVPPQKITWYTVGGEEPGKRERIQFTPPSGVQFKGVPPDDNLNAMIERGDIDALMDPSVPASFLKKDSKVKRLFPDYRAVEQEYFKRTGIFPIMHTLAIKEEIYEKHPWVAISLYKAFCQAKELAYKWLFTGHSLLTSAWAGAAFAEERAVLGDDLWPYGLEPNRKTVETLAQYEVEQGLIPKAIAIESLFAKETVETVKIG